MSLIMEAIKKAQQMRWPGNQGNSWSKGILGPGISLEKNRRRWRIFPVFLCAGGLIILIFGVGLFSFSSPSSLWMGAKKMPKEDPALSKSRVGESHPAEKNPTVAVREQKPPAPPPAGVKTEKIERPFLPLTLVTVSESARPKEVFPEKEILLQRAEESPEGKDLRTEVRAVAEKKEEKEEKTQWPATQEQEKTFPSSAQEVPASDIKVEKLISEDRTPHEAVKNFNAGVNFYQQRNLNQAIQAYKKALEYNPHYLEAYNNLALIYQEIGDLNQARETLQRAIEINPHYEKAMNNLGIILLLQNRYGEAKELFQKILLRNPHHAESYLNLGVLYRKEGDTKKAAECYQKALQINPLRGEVHYNLAIIWEELNDIPQAINHYRSFLHLAGKDYPGLAAEVTRHINRLGKEQRGR